MSDTFRLQGTYSTTPLVGVPSGFPSLAAPINEIAQLAGKQPGQYTLDTDAAVDVAFGGLSAANVVIIKAVGGPIRVRLTTGSESDQVVRVDSFLVLLSYTVPYTAIDLTRSPGVETIVEVFLGQTE